VVSLAGVLQLPINYGRTTKQTGDDERIALTLFYRTTSIGLFLENLIHRSFRCSAMRRAEQFTASSNKQLAYSLLQTDASHRRLGISQTVCEVSRDGLRPEILMERATVSPVRSRKLDRIQFREFRIIVAVFRLRARLRLVY